MCTLIVFHRVWEDAPLVLAVNRDEAYDRPSSPPAWRDGAPPALMPRDERAGGTWMGATAGGLWVGLTNLGPTEDPGRRSRGLLCLDLLACADAAAVGVRVRALREPYNAFQVVAADLATGVWLTEYEAGRSRTRELPHGCHVVTNRPSEQAADEPKVGRVRQLLAEARLWPAGARAPADLAPTLEGVLADHGVEGRDALCLHGGRYGTRSAAVWRIGPAAPANHPESATGALSLDYADGPPCSVPFRPIAGFGGATS